VIANIRQVLPEGLGQRMDALTSWAPADRHREPIQIDQAGLRRAMRQQRKICFRYRDAGDLVSERRGRPLVMAFYGPVWVLAAWREDRGAFRVFQLDRMAELTILDERFRAEPGKTAFDFLKQQTGRRKVGLASG